MTSNSDLSPLNSISETDDIPSNFSSEISDKFSQDEISSNPQENSIETPQNAFKISPALHCSFSPPHHSSSTSISSNPFHISSSTLQEMSVSVHELQLIEPVQASFQEVKKLGKMEKMLQNALETPLNCGLIFFILSQEQHDEYAFLKVIREGEISAQTLVVKSRNFVANSIKVMRWFELSQIGVESLVYRGFDVLRKIWVPLDWEAEIRS